MLTHDPLREATEIREQLASDKRRLGFFFGAGTSMAVNLPGIVQLTDSVEGKLKPEHRTLFQSIKKELPGKPNVEDILNRIRLYRELIGNSETLEYCNIKGRIKARELDVAICKTIAESVGKIPDKTFPHLILANWIRSLHANREYPIEIFTTNYDLLLEHAFEITQVPYFDGFLGSVAPFFIPESIEAGASKEEGLNYYPPKSWTRLWKLHGSINWCLNDKMESRICRFSGQIQSEGQELMIFPSREKYSESRKLPFIALQDRLRKFLSTKEVLLIIHGYNFSDQHLNDIIFQGIRANPHLAIMAFIFEKLPEKFQEYGRSYRKLSFYAPDKLCIGGITAEWSKPSREQKTGEKRPFWDEKKHIFLLGNFNEFASYLENFIGFNYIQAPPSSIDGVSEEKTKREPNK